MVFTWRAVDRACQPCQVDFPWPPLVTRKAHAMTAPCEKSRPDVRRGSVSHRVRYGMHTVCVALCSGRRERSSPSGLTFPTSTTDQGSEACKAHASVSAHVTSPARSSSSMYLHSYSTRLDGDIDVTTHFGTPLSSSTRKGLSYRAAAFEPHSKLLAVACALQRQYIRNAATPAEHAVTAELTAPD